MYYTSMQTFTLLPARRICKALYALTHCDSISIIDTETPPYMRWAKDLVKLISKAGLGTFFSPFHHNQSILHLQILHHQRMYWIPLICTSMFPVNAHWKVEEVNTSDQFLCKQHTFDTYREVYTQEIQSASFNNCDCLESCTSRWRIWSPERCFCCRLFEFCDVAKDDKWMSFLIEIYALHTSTYSLIFPFCKTVLEGAR